jgi:hypothetical protein
MVYHEINQSFHYYYHYYYHIIILLWLHAWHEVEGNIEIRRKTKLFPERMDIKRFVI